MASSFNTTDGYTIKCDGDHGLLPAADPYRDTDWWYPSVWRRMMAAGWMIRDGEEGPLYLCRECSGKPRLGSNR